MNWSRVWRRLRLRWSKTVAVMTEMHVCSPENSSCETCSHQNAAIGQAFIQCSVSTNIVWKDENLRCLANTVSSVLLCKWSNCGFLDFNSLLDWIILNKAVFWMSANAWNQHPTRETMRLTICSIWQRQTINILLKTKCICVKVLCCCDAQPCVKRASKSINTLLLSNLWEFNNFWIQQEASDFISPAITLVLWDEIIFYVFHLNVFLFFTSASNYSLFIPFAVS